MACGLAMEAPELSSHPVGVRRANVALLTPRPSHCCTSAPALNAVAPRRCQS
jgi:hypothetical protein